MALKHKTNGVLPKSAQAAGYGSVDYGADAEMDAIDRLPTAISRALAAANIAISAVSILDRYSKGMKVAFILDAIEQAQRNEAVLGGTIPDRMWLELPLSIRAPQDRANSAAGGHEPRRQRMDRTRPRRLPRNPGSY